MVEITKIENQKNKNKFNLFVDGLFYCGILKETAIANNFFVGKKIEEKDLKQIILASHSKEAFNKATDYLATRHHSKQELKLKLIKKGFSTDSVDLAIKKLEDYGYINDLQFAKLFIEQNKNYSKQMLISKLINKGVSKTDIDTCFLSLPQDNELELAENLAQKYLKNKDISTCKEKLYAHLLRKGFGYDTIKIAIKNVTKVDIE